MNGIEDAPVACPYCGETIEIAVDRSAGSQRYIEDCPVCCQPIELTISLDEETGRATVIATREDEA